MVALPYEPLEPAPEYTRVTLRLPTDLVAKMRARYGRRGLSEAATEILEDAERNAGLGDWLEEMERIHGPLPEEVLEEARRRWPEFRDVL